MCESVLWPYHASPSTRASVTQSPTRVLLGGCSHEADASGRRARRRGVPIAQSLSPGRQQPVQGHSVSCSRRRHDGPAHDRVAAASMWKHAAAGKRQGRAWATVSSRRPALEWPWDLGRMVKRAVSSRVDTLCACGSLAIVCRRRFHGSEKNWAVLRSKITSGCVGRTIGRCRLDRLCAVPLGVGLVCRRLRCRPRHESTSARVLRRRF